jgi:uncharacterized protein
MSRSMPEIPVIDSHVHFFSPNFVENYAKLGKERLGAEASVPALLELMGWKMGDSEPVELARRWVAEMDSHGIAKMVLVTSWPGDEEATAQAVAAFPDRFGGYVMVNPLVDGSAERAKRAVTELGLQAISIFPAMMGFRASDDAAYPVYHAARQAGAPVFVHFGILKVGIRDKLGLVSNFDLRNSNPLDLYQVAKDFPDIEFIVPHFGCGYFQELLMVASQCPNVNVDTSSSNSWVNLMPYPLTLKDVFAKTLDILGPERIIFGSDSTAFPKGWRSEIFESQAEILKSLNRGTADLNLIFSENAQRIFGL